MAASTTGLAAVNSTARRCLSSNDPVVQRLARRPFKAKIEGSNPSGVTTPPGFSPPSCRSRVRKSKGRPKAVPSRAALRYRSASNPSGCHSSGALHLQRRGGFRGSPIAQCRVVVVGRDAASPASFDVVGATGGGRTPLGCGLYPCRHRPSLATPGRDPRAPCSRSPAWPSRARSRGRPPTCFARRA